MSTDDDAAFMRRALELAARGAGMVQPNPMVGAVVARDGIVIGEGWHEVYGSPHAEVNALRQAADAARGATMYVTLEPCAHHGRTPPCADAIIAAGIAAVHIAVADPNDVAGGGAVRLRDAGMRVTGGTCEQLSRRLNAAFFHWHERGTPYVVLKQAVSADARIAAAPGQRTTISGPEANAEVHRMRARHDAILVGIGTALIDDPLLTVRNVPVVRQPVRVIVDTTARLPLTSQLVHTIAQAPVWLLTAHDAPAERLAALEAAGVRTFRLPRAHRGIDLERGIAALGAAGIRSVFVEAGETIAASLIQGRMIHRLHLMGSPHSIGENGVPALVMEPHRWTETERRRIGADELLTFDLAEHA